MYQLKVTLALTLLVGCALLSSEPSLPCPPAITAAPAPTTPKPVEQICEHADQWTPSAQADAAMALAPLAHANPNVAHLVMEWARLRADSDACQAAQSPGK